MKTKNRTTCFIVISCHVRTLCLLYYSVYRTSTIPMRIITENSAVLPNACYISLNSRLQFRLLKINCSRLTHARRWLQFMFGCRNCSRENMKSKDPNLPPLPDILNLHAIRCSRLRRIVYLIKKQNSNLQTASINTNFASALSAERHHQATNMNERKR